MHEPHPIHLVVEDDYRRTRITVFFRLILAIPHLIWFGLWTVLIIIAAVVNWLISIFTGKPPPGLHRLMCSYIRYQAHLTAYLALVGNPYPGFTGEPGEYPIDIRLPEEPVAQRRWTILLRFLLAVPALIVSGALAGLSGGNIGSSRGRKSARRGTGGGALLFVCAVLGDSVNYWIGSRVGPAVFRREDSIFLRKKHLERAHAFFQKYGGRAVILARFVPIVRTFVPFVAGIGSMSYRQFMAFNVVGGFVWVYLFTYAGYFFGGLEKVQKNFHYVILAIIFVSVLPIVFEFVRGWLESRKAGQAAAAK